MAVQGMAARSRSAGTILWPVARLLRATGIGTLAGIAAGLVAGGVGSRLAMKVVALVAGPGARGMITENGNRVGAFTGDTLFLLFFGALLGTFGGLLYVALRPWLLRSSRWRGLTFGALLLATCGVAVIEGDNFDFHRFGSPVLNIVLFATLFLAFGLLVAPIADGADRLFPAVPPRRNMSIGTIGAYVVLAGCALLGLFPVAVAFAVGLLGQGEDDAKFRLVLVLFLALLAISLVARVLDPRARRRGGAPAGAERGAASRAAVAIVLAVPLLIGLVLLLRAIAAILAVA